MNSKRRIPILCSSFRARCSKNDADMQAQIIIVNSQSTQRHGHDRAITRSGSDINAHGFLLFKEYFPVALCTRKHASAAGAATALTGIGAGNDEKNNSAVFGFSSRQS